MGKYKDKTVFHLPGLFEFYGLYQALLTEYTNNRDVFEDNVVIGSVYGIPSNVIWNGGRGNLRTNNTLLRPELEFIKNEMENFQIPVRFTFTNPLLLKKHTHDTYCNMILDIFNNGHNEVIVNSPILEEYIRDNYEDSYKYISSTTKRLNDEEEQLAELNENYYLVVLDYDYNKDYEFIKSIPEDQREKCEILCNPVCHPKCKRRLEHYRDIAECQLNFITSTFPCDDSDKFYHEARQNKLYIGPDEINNYLDLGVHNFKLEGRTAPPLDVVEILLDYLIKDEFKEEIRLKLQLAIW